MPGGTDDMVSVRYMVDDVRAAIDFYATHFGFTVRSAAVPAFADVARGQGGRAFDRQEDQWGVPGRQSQDDAHRLLASKCHYIGFFDRDDRAFDLVSKASVVVPVFGLQL